MSVFTKRDFLHIDATARHMEVLWVGCWQLAVCEWMSLIIAASVNTGLTSHHSKQDFDEAVLLAMSAPQVRFSSLDLLHLLCCIA